ncbi:carboxyl transferase domain-containing protein [Actinophytocola xanthii]|uniref:Acetyl-coenzyme A carboxylase carboxyl transferase subunits beta/alpha n=1 Tax=Actinophytocola xanthii TaxID=1912961 RepID=A0A1Q8CM01_9PSEU|nr:carboxyl transferase domain-containing protein [Actinophytocola xanthii]OLF15374.1 acetyl-CoA carboxylase [Actinophytocola xanthii]
MKPGARDAIRAVSTDFTEFDVDDGRYGPDGPLDWPGYATQRESAARLTDTAESVVCGRARVGAAEVVLVSFDFRYLGGSVGTGTGARIVHAFDRARVSGLPLVSLIATGGTRMQEGMLSLRQLQLVARAAARLRESGLPHVAVLQDPTTGGVWASLGAGADVILALPGAQVAFAGRRVRPPRYADDPAFTAEHQYAAGHVDELVAPDQLPTRLADWLVHLGQPAPGSIDIPRPLGDQTPRARDAWHAVQQARSPHRPRAAAYLDDYFDSRVLIRGDRTGGVDEGMLCGMGRRRGHSIAYAAQTGTATTPAGFRTAARLIRLADRLGLPVLTLVDTPGAAADPEAERGGTGPAIATLFATIAEARVPVTTLVVGEGGSGGALALCSQDRLWITPDAYFSVIAPELAAQILKLDPSEVPELAGRLRLRPEDLLELGVVHGIATG